MHCCIGKITVEAAWPIGGGVSEDPEQAMKMKIEELEGLCGDTFGYRSTALGFKWQHSATLSSPVQSGVANAY